MSIELAWAAGFWDGEGCTSVSARRGTASVPRIVGQIAQVDREVLDRFADALGIGNVLGPYKSKNPKAQDYYCWRVEGMKNFYHIKESLFPYLGTQKKNQMIRAIETREVWEATAECQYGHRLSQSSGGHWRCLECQSVNGKKNAKAILGHKVCSFCKEDKNFSEFNKMRSRLDGHQTVCRACMKNYRDERSGG